MNCCSARSAMILLAVVLGTAGCGQKGPLYLPPPGGTVPAKQTTANKPAADMNNTSPASSDMGTSK